MITSEDVDVADVVFDGENYLVVWARQYGDSNNPLHAARVSPAGVVLDAEPIRLPLTSQSWGYLTPVAASDGIFTLLVANQRPRR